MRSKFMILGIASAIILTVGQLRQAAADSFDGEVDGTELVTQSVGGQAVFIFRFFPLQFDVDAQLSIKGTSHRNISPRQAL